MPREFELETGTPEAVRETELHRAEQEWQRRSDEVAAKIKTPRAPYRIRGDTKKNCWFVEGAEIERSAKPEPDFSYSRYMMPYFGRPTKAMVAAYEAQEEEEARKLIARYAEDKPKAKLVWKSMAFETDEDGDTTTEPSSFRTYAAALKWLREELEPVRDESVYFTEDGREAVA